MGTHEAQKVWYTRPQSHLATPMPRLTHERIREAIATGELPHEFLLRVSRGEVIDVTVLEDEKYLSGPKKGQIKAQKERTIKWAPTMKERVEAAKFAAPFYAPKLATQTVQVSDEDMDRGVVVVPATAALDDWQSAAFEAQRALKGQMKDAA